MNINFRKKNEEKVTGQEKISYSSSNPYHMEANHGQ